MKIIKFIPLLISFSLIWFIIIQLSLSQDYIKIKLKIIFPNITVQQGIPYDTAFKAENLHDESLIVDYEFEKPEGMNISFRPEKWSNEIAPNESATIHISITAGKEVENGMYTIKVWAKALEMIGDKNIQSDKYPIGVTVLYNATLHTTTTTTTITTTTTTLIEEKIREELTTNQNMVIVIIVIIVTLILIPYLSFRG